MKNPWHWFKALFARRGDDPRNQQRFFSPYAGAGVQLTPDQALSLSAVWACISIISTAIGTCRWKLFEPTGPNRRRLVTDDPLHYVLNTRPNPDMTAIGFREAMLMVAIPYGNAYAEIVLDRGGRVAQLWPLEPDRVRPRRNPETWALEYEYDQPGDGTTVVLPQSSVFHLRGPGLGGLMGENIIARAAKSIGVAAAQERYTASFFGQGANPGGTLELPAGVTLTPEQKQELKDDWAERKKGPENAHKPMFLENGWKWNQSTVDPQKSQLVEGRQFSVEEICRWFHVPPHKVQHLLRATYSNIEHQSIEFVRDACTPWSRALEQEADFKLIGPPRGGRPARYTCIDMAPLMAGDLKSRAEGYGTLRQNGFITANEVREELGLNDAGADGDVLLVQGALTTVERILNPPEQKALPAGAPPEPDEDDAELDPDVDADIRALRKLVGELELAMREQFGSLHRQLDRDATAASQLAARFADVTQAVGALRDSAKDDREWLHARMKEAQQLNEFTRAEMERAVAESRVTREFVETQARANRLRDIAAFRRHCVDALEERGRVLAHRRADFERSKATDIEKKLAAAREECWPKFRNRMWQAQPLAISIAGREFSEADLRSLLHAVDAGVSPVPAIEEALKAAGCPQLPAGSSP